MFGGLHAPMLARLGRTLPRGDLWRYEPKLDGFGGLLWRAPSGSVTLLSRNLKDLSHAFPELLEAGRDLPLVTLVDGEIGIADGDGPSNFAALQKRLGTASRDAAREALQAPAVLLAFDLVRDAGAELAERPLHDRRLRLEALLGDVGGPHLQLVCRDSLRRGSRGMASFCGQSGGRGRQALRRSLRASPA